MFNPDDSMDERLVQLSQIQNELHHLEVRRRVERPRAQPKGNRLLDELRTHVPFLTSGFTAHDDDIVAILNALSSARGMGLATSSGSDINQDAKVADLEVQVKTLTQRLQRRESEVDHLRDDLGEARGRAKAVEEQSRLRANTLSQRRDEMKKHLLTEESRTAKLQHQNKLLQQEVDRLRSRLHDSMK